MLPKTYTIAIICIACVLYFNEVSSKPAANSLRSKNTFSKVFKPIIKFGNTGNSGSSDDSEECTGYFTDLSGNISSTHYPNNYFDNTTCSWDIEVPLGHRIRLNFLEFHLETSPDCEKDYMEIFDGQEYRLFCGRDPPPEIISAGNQIALLLITDGSIHVGHKFFAQYEAFSDVISTTMAPIPTTTEAPDSCMGTAYLDDEDEGYGFFASPGHPENYPSYSKCRWDLLRSSVQGQIATRVGFLRFRTEVTYDPVEIYQSGTLLDRYTGDLQKSNTSSYKLNTPNVGVYTSANVSVSFTSDSDITRSGFIFAYAKQLYDSDPYKAAKINKAGIKSKRKVSLKKSKGHRTKNVVKIDLKTKTVSSEIPELTKLARFEQDWEYLNQSYGFFMSPNHPSSYPQNTDIAYDITAERSQRIAIYILRFRTESSYDVLSIEDWETGHVETHSGYPTVIQDNVYVSSSSNVVATFTSDSSTQYTGFLAAFASVEVTDV